MPRINSTVRAVIKRCQRSPSFFIENFCKVQHPKAGILPFNLFKYQKESILAYRRHRYTIYRKCRQCFAAGSMVWTPSGPKSIETINPGDEVYSLNPSGHLEVVAVADVYDNGVSDCVEVRTKTGHRAVCTKDHEYHTRSGWIEAKALDGEVVTEVHDYPRYGYNADESEAILLGYLVTDGSYGRWVMFNNSCWKYLLEYQKHFELKFGKRLKLRKRKSGFKTDSDINYRIQTNHGPAREWLKALGILGQTGTDKRLPECVFNWNNESISILLNRMFAADGWYSGGNVNEVGIGQESIILLHQIKQLLSRFGISSKFYPATKNNIAKLRIYGSQDFARFVEQIGIYGKSPRNPITKGFFFNRKKGEIKSIEKIGRRRVYDLNVPPYHNYIVDGAVVHNCGISTLTGVYALWLAMFHPNVTILIVSKTDRDAMGFLRKNVKLVYNYLPDFFKQIYGDPPITYSDHRVVFPNGSSIQSLTSNKEVLRSHSSTLNIIDEAAFMPDMDDMWAGGQPTLMHGGSVIVISTCKGVGNWYYNTWMDSEAGANDFHPINIRWWDMDWEIKFKDIQSATGETTICPRRGIRKTTKEEEDTFGEYWSPWLLEQYRALQERGEAHLFRQEVLAEFIGSGNTVVDRKTLLWIEKTRRDEFYTVKHWPYTHPHTEEEHVLDYQDQLWIWNRPVKPEPDVIERGQVIVPGKPGHIYVAGVDVSSGEDRDFSSIEVFDVTTKEQVAELNIKVLPHVLAMMVDCIATWYNGAFVVPERTGIGIPVCNDIYKLYANVYRLKLPNGKRSSKIGHPTSAAHKPAIDKALMTMMGEDNYQIYSHRLYKQLAVYVHLTEKKTGAEPGIGNHVDCAIAAGLALMGAEDAIQSDITAMVPTRYVANPDMPLNKEVIMEEHKAIASGGGLNAVVPYYDNAAFFADPETKADMALQDFTKQIGGLTMQQLREPIRARKHVIKKPFNKAKTQGGGQHPRTNI